MWLYVLVFTHASLWQLPADAWWVWVVGLVFYDFCYYWHHRFGHTVALFWAAHVVHHQSEDYNLSTALRQTGSGWVGGWLFYLPMAVLGFPPLVFGVVALIDLLYQYWVHTQQIGKLGWFDRWFCAPSNHRVHHAVNDKYLDKNYGGIFIVWDRLFGSFIEEDDRGEAQSSTAPAARCAAGTRCGPTCSTTPTCCKDSWHAASWADKLRVWFKHPGWRPADVAARFPKPEFDITRVERYDPPMSPAAQWAAAGLFVALLGATSLLLWNAHRMSLPQQAAAALGVIGGLWVVGWVSERGPQR